MKKTVLSFFFVFIFSAFTFADDIRIETIGILGGQNLYLAYTVLGLLAQGCQSGTISPEFAGKMAKDTASSCRKSRSSLLDLLDGKILTDSDSDDARDLITGYEALVDEANAVVSMAETPSEEAGKQYIKFKNRAWDKIVRALRLED